MSASIYDVAKLANVSIATVSRVLNNSANVSKKKVQAIHAAIQQLNYEPNVMAKGLAQNVTGLIGLYLPGGGLFGSSDYYIEIFRGILEGLQKTQYSIVLIIDDNILESAAEVPKYFRYIAQKRIDGLLLNGMDQGTLSAKFKELLYMEFPVAYIGRRVEDKCLNVYAEYSWYTAKVLEYFYSAGHRKIIMPAQNNNEFFLLRFQECLNEFNEGKEEPMTVYYYMEDKFAVYNEMEEQLMGFIKSGATGIYFSELSSAERILSFFAAYDITVPNEMSAIGGEHIPKKGSLLLPEISCFYVPSFEIGKAAAEMLVAQLNGENEGQEKERLIFPQYFDRGSLKRIK